MEDPHGKGPPVCCVVERHSSPEEGSPIASVSLPSDVGLTELFGVGQHTTANGAIGVDQCIDANTIVTHARHHAPLSELRVDRPYG